MLHYNKLFIFALIASAVLLFSPQSTLAGSYSEKKIKVCHFNSSSDTQGKIITIARKAYKAHLDHGDPPEGEFYMDTEKTCKRIPDDAKPKKLKGR